MGIEADREISLSLKIQKMLTKIHQSATDINLIVNT